MKQRAKLIAVLIMTLVLFSAKKGNECPPGTVKFNETIFIDKCEVSNVSWKEYVYWNKAKYGISSDVYKSSLPDTTIWSLDKNSTKTMDANYYQHPAYSEYPVVGISYAQAKKFCKWRSDRVNEMLYNKGSNSNANPLESKKDIPEIYKYRLPTESEWEAVASLDFSKKTQKKILKQKTKVYNLDSESGDYTAPVWSSQANVIGVYNIIGNVAEMIAEDGTAKGGAYFHKQYEVSVESDFAFTVPTNWVGLRCVCEKVKK